MFSLAALGCAFRYEEILGDSLKWVAVGSLVTYIICFAFSLGPIAWLLISEVFPLKIRGVAMSICTLANFAFNFFVVGSFPILLNILIAGVTLLCMYEIFSAMNILDKYILTVPTFLFNIIVSFFVTPTIMLSCAYLYTVLLFIFMISLKKKVIFKEIAVVYTLTIVITFSLNLFLVLRDKSGVYGTFYTVLILVIAWLADTGAYFFGSLFGKHKLCPEISPKKTVEGAVFGVISSIASSLLVYFIFNTYLFEKHVEINLLYVALIAFFGAIISIIGDLSFSLVKRSCNVKDFGNVIPGHGGMLDRMDSVILVVPYVFIIDSFFPIIPM